MLILKLLSGNHPSSDDADNDADNDVIPIYDQIFFNFCSHLKTGHHISTSKLTQYFDKNINLINQYKKLLFGYKKEN